MKTIYLIRHSAPFIEIENYDDYENVLWDDYNRNMILSSEGEENAKKLCKLDELSHLDAVYAADSFRAIGTAKYVAELNNLKIRLDKRINERDLGVKTISELPKNQTLDSFSNKDYKFGSGESLNEVDNRFNTFLDEILNSENNRVALFIHGIIMMSFLQNNTDFSFDGRIMRLVFHDKEVYNDNMKNPMVFRVDFEDNKIVNIEYIDF